jgi:hypothetical protein
MLSFMIASVSRSPSTYGATRTRSVRAAGVPIRGRRVFSLIREIFGRRDVQVSGRPDGAPRKLDTCERRESAALGGLARQRSLAGRAASCSVDGGAVAVDEIANNSLIEALLAPDVSLGGTKAISIGVGFSATKATFTVP